MGKKDFFKTTLSTTAGIINPFTGLATVILTEGIDYFYEKYRKIKIEKVLKFYSEFQNWLNLNLKDIDKEFLNEPYFEEILEIILTKISSSSSERKIKIFQQILQERVKAKKSNDMSRTYLDIIEKITEEELELLKTIYKLCIESKTYIEKDDILSKINLNDKFNLYTRDLISKGILIQNNLGGEAKAVYITDLGIKLIEFITGKN